jgi:hypothetical protein
MCDRNGLWRFPLLLFSTVDHPTDDGGEEVLGGSRGLSGDDGNRVADATFELADHSFGVIDSATFGRLAHQHVTVVTEVEH